MKNYYVIINPTDENYIRQVANLHREYISKGFLSKLGVDFLGCIYKAITISKHSDLILYISDGEVLGFIAGTTNIYDIKLNLLKVCSLKILRIFLIKSIKLKNIKKIFETLRYTSSSRTNLPKAELLSIVVKRKAQGSGVAQILYESLCESFKRRGVDKFKIIVGEELNRAQKFYTKMGAKPIGYIELHKGSKSIVYIHRL